MNLLGVEKRMERTDTILVTLVIMGAVIFLGFYLTLFYDYSILGIQSLEEFLSMCGLLIFIISGFFLFSLKTNRYQI